jgi:serine/threonine protein kinase
MLVVVTYLSADRRPVPPCLALLLLCRLRFVCRLQEEDYNLFLDLVSKMLTYEPTERITPEDALRHPFLQRDR